MMKASCERCLLVAVLSCLLAGCSQLQAPSASAELDPFEGYNRKIFAFNVVMDKLAIRPASYLYKRVTPPVFQRGFAHMLSNLNEPNRVLNDLLQGELAWALNDLWRFLVNSTIGLGGFFDVARTQDLLPHHQDLGLTLAAWGWEQSRFIMLPIVGATTVRDGLVALPMDYSYLGVYQTMHQRHQYRLLGLRTLDSRADLLAVDHVIEHAFDPYVFVRNAYLQRRQRAIEDLTYHSAFANMADH